MGKRVPTRIPTCQRYKLSSCRDLTAAESSVNGGANSSNRLLGSSLSRRFKAHYGGVSCLWVLAFLSTIGIEATEPLLQAVYGRSPPRRRGFADGILVAEKTDLVHRPLQGHGLELTHGHEGLATFRIVDELAVVVSPSGSHVLCMRARARFRTWTTDKPSWRPFSYVRARHPAVAHVHKTCAGGPGYSSPCIFMQHHNM